MANLYVADDGTIHDRDIELHERVTPSNPISDPPAYVDVVPNINIGRKVVFWIVTVTLSLLIGYVLYRTVGVLVFEKTNNPTKLIEHLQNFFCIIAPFVVVGGAATCAIIYAAKCAESHGYRLGAYILSVLSSAGGTVGAGIVVFLLAYIITIILYGLLIAVIIALFVAIFGGN